MKKPLLLGAYLLGPLLLRVCSTVAVVASGSLLIGSVANLSLIALLLVAIVSFCRRGRRAEAIALSTSLFLVFCIDYLIGFSALRARVYDADRLWRPAIWAQCQSKDAMDIDDGELRICDYNDYGIYVVDIIVRITGNTPVDKIMMDTHHELYNEYQ
jgi:hypothetical protein